MVFLKKECQITVRSMLVKHLVSSVLNGISNAKISPHYPQSTGKAEKTVGIAKQLIQKRKKKKGGKDIELALQDYRNAPLQVIDNHLRSCLWFIHIHINTCFVFVFLFVFLYINMPSQVFSILNVSGFKMSLLISLTS